MSREGGDVTADDGTPRRWGTSHFELGVHDALIGPRTLGLVEAGHSTTREQLWTLVESSAPLDEILDDLSTAGLRSLPSFALAFEDGTGLRVVARGAARVRVTKTDGSVEEIDPSDVRTWSEEFFDAVATVELRIVDHVDSSEEWSAISDRYFVLAGAVPAGRVGRDYVNDTVLAPRAAAEWERRESLDADDAGIDELPSPEEIVPEPVAVESGPHPEVSGSAPGAAIDPFGFSSRSAPNATEAPVAVATADAAEMTQPPEQPVEPDADSLDIESARVAPSVLISSVPTATSEPEPAGSNPERSSAEPVGSDMSSQVPAAAEELSSDEEPRADAGLSSPLLLDDETATVGRDALGGAGADVDDLDSLTISREDLSRRRAEAPALAMPGPLEVHALVCACGSANPPARVGCRTCGAALDGEELQVVDRPTLAVLEFSTGETFPVDRNVLIGRNPKVEQSHAGELPRIARIDSDNSGLSRTHAQVGVEGWDMLLEDLGSRNGTSVTLPGKPARRLHPGEPVLLEIGAVIEFDDDVQCLVRAER